MDPSPPAVSDEPRRLLTDKQAIGLLIAYLVFRAIANRVGLAYLPQLLEDAPWAIPLLNNSMLTLIGAGTGVSGSVWMMVATALASIFQSFVAGFVLYWAGYRFGSVMAERAKKPGSMWASVWNPKQIERATRWIQQRGHYAIFIGRGFIEWMLTPIVLVAGSVKMRIRTFVLAFGGGSIVYAVLMLWLGDRAGTAWPWLPDRIKAFGDWSLRIAIGLVVLTAILFLIANRLPSEEPVAEDVDEGRAPPDERPASDAQDATIAPAQSESERPSPPSVDS